MHHPNHRPRTLAFALCIASVGAGCASGPPAPRYLLEPAPAGGVQELPGALDSLGLATVALPGYVVDSSIVGRAAAEPMLGPLDIDTGAQWSESPEAALTRTLAESLRLRSGASVLVEPLPRGFDPEARIEVVFDRLLRNASGGAEMAGQVQVIAGDGRELISVRGFELARPGADDSDASFFEALSIAIDDLARLILDAVSTPA